MGEKMRSQEIEFKTLIDYKTFNKLLESYNLADKGDFLQINYYYDTPNFDFLKKQETLRVRQINNILKLQYKYNKKTDGNIRTAEEFTKTLDDLPIRMVFNEYILEMKGNLVTRRYEIPIESALICLDVNYYLGHIDYELEIEASAIEVIDDIVNSLNISRKNVVGKCSRFMNRLNLLMNENKEMSITNE